jgi:transposase-like protein
MHIHEHTTVKEILSQMPANAHLSLVRESDGIWVAEVGSVRERRCPHCGNYNLNKVWRMPAEAESTHDKWKCTACFKNFETEPEPEKPQPAIAVRP